MVCGNSTKKEHHGELDKSKGTFLYGECEKCGEKIQHTKWENGELVEV